MLNEKYLILSINPGSTSTKVALFKDEERIFIESIFHDSSILSTFESINDQLDYRNKVLFDFLSEKDIDMNTVDAIVGRGGPSYSVKSGIYEVDDLLIKDTREFKGGLYHSSCLGIQMAYALHKRYPHTLCLMSNPTVTDEYDDIARVTGVKGVYRQCALHALNMKEVARRYSLKVNKNYEDLTLITAHIDGGISMAVHKNGRMIDGIDGGGGEGPFTPTRMGGMAISTFNNSLHDLSFQEVRQLLSVKGGFSNYFNTSNSDVIHKMVEDGDKEATLIYNAMIYQCCKTIGSLAPVADGKIDAILLTGGLCRFDDLVDKIKKSCSFIAPIKVYPGEYEHEAMTNAALEVLSGKTIPLKYTGKPVFEGFDFIK
ncbi:MAG: butyrate kinase [Erysipelotrichaceae bacterium]|nr:butyrate kinase [Erysipelotrichaceae bacterium]